MHRFRERAYCVRARPKFSFKNNNAVLPSVIKLEIIQWNCLHHLLCSDTGKIGKVGKSNFNSFVQFHNIEMLYVVWIYYRNSLELSW